MKNSVNFVPFLILFKECVSGLADFIDISGLAIRGLENFAQAWSLNQGCGSRSRLNPDSMTLWIRIRIWIGNPDPDPRARK
jgi:hypothetical protein